VNEVAGSWTGDTVVKATFRRPIALSEMLAAVPDVAEVIEEPLAEDSEAVLRSLRPLGLGMTRTPPRRFRIILKQD